MMTVDRTAAKAISLGGVFSMGEGKLAMTLGLPYTEERGWLKAGPEAQALFAQYHEAVPGVQEMRKRASAVAVRRGYVRSIRGRVLQFPKGFEYRAAGYLYQAFTADTIKSAMVVVDELAPIHLTVHDELIFSITNDDVIYEIKQAMEACMSDVTEVPLYVEPEIGPNWAETRGVTQ
jgi:DNA polymerase I-like protein with 3'-5' exonuclease and polymerase domains